jgi:hypothetical protein
MTIPTIPLSSFDMGLRDKLTSLGLASVEYASSATSVADLVSVSQPLRRRCRIFPG